MAKTCTTLIVSVSILVTVCASGCANPVSQSQPPSSTSPSGQLEQTTWLLASFTTETGLENVLSNTTITARFDNGNITGSAGCNRYSAGYQLSGNDISVSSILSTLMYCTTPDGVMTQETTYLVLLTNVTAYTISNDQLTLSNATGDSQLVFNAATNVTV